MKEKIKKIIFGYLPGFITGIIICGGISVIAATYFPSNDVTYNNKESGLVSTNVQGAIDELYTECTTIPAGDQIIEDAELEKDPYECRYFFTGANPNNYITFNDETAGWRIISVECDGTIKIMRTASIDNMVWDSSNSNNWARPASLNTYLNSTYYNGLNSIAKSQIIAKNFSIGKIINENNDLAGQVNDENEATWKGKIALITVSEYIRTNSNKSSCGTFSMNNSNFSTCVNTNWLNNTNGWLIWTLSTIGDNGEVYDIYTNASSYNQGMISIDYTNGELPIRPTIYLSSDIKITGGDGSQSNPYEISL